VKNLSTSSAQALVFKSGTNGKPELLLPFETLSPSLITESVFLSDILSEHTSIPVREIIDTSVLIRFFEKFILKTTVETLQKWRERHTIQGIFTDDEIKEKMQLHLLFREIIRNSLIEVIDVLQLENEENYVIDITSERDIELPQWIETVISIKIERRSDEDKIRLWEQIEERVRNIIERIRITAPKPERRKIDRISENLSLRVEELVV